MSTAMERRRIARESRDAPTSGWLNVAWRVKDDVAADDASMIAAGAAFFGLLAHTWIDDARSMPNPQMRSSALRS